MSSSSSESSDEFEDEHDNVLSFRDSDFIQSHQYESSSGMDEDIGLGSDRQRLIHHHSEESRL